MADGEKVTRKLRAILSADVKGYSLLMADDEIHTIETLKKYRGLMSDLIQQHSGRVVDNPGDNLLAEFSSAVDAVECSVQIQKKLEKENARFVEARRLDFRIGINIGDIVQDGDRIYGEGVNIAARIESLSDAGGICVSRNTYDQVKSKLDYSFEYLGEHEVKNIEEPVRVYKVLMSTDVPKPLVEVELELPDKPSIAVLPFTNMSGDPSQEYFSDGLTEQIINGLCKVSNLFVIARNSSFAYKGKAVSVKQIAKELGVRYILEGSVQKAGNRVRITAQLIDATTDFHMWSETYDRDLEDIFALQDEITRRLISLMDVHLTFGEQAMLWNISIRIDLKAYDLMMRGIDCFNKMNKGDNAQARAYFKKSLEIDTSSLTYALIGVSHTIDLLYGWSENPIESFSKADKCSTLAIDMNNKIDLVHILLSWVFLLKRQHDEAVEEAKTAIKLNPNGAHAHVILGMIQGFCGNYVEAVGLINKGLRLNPNPPHHYYQILGACYRGTQQFRESELALKRSIKMNPDGLPSLISLASCYGLMDQIDNAKDVVKDILRLDPKYSIDTFSLTMPFKYTWQHDMFVESLRKAGLPEHSP